MLIPKRLHSLLSMIFQLLPCHPGRSWLTEYLFSLFLFYGQFLVECHNLQLVLNANCSTGRIQRLIENAAIFRFAPLVGSFLCTGSL